MLQVLTQGERIKWLRKRLGLTQYDLTAGEFTRNYISMVENGDSSLSLKAADLISSIMNRVISDKNLPIEAITSSYLLESMDEQISRIFNEGLINLQENFTNKVIFEKTKDEIIEFMSKNKVSFDEKREFYNIVISYYRGIRDYTNHEKYTLELFVLSDGNINVKLDSMCRLIVNYTETERYDQARLLRDLSLKIITDFEIKQSMTNGKKSRKGTLRKKPHNKETTNNNEEELIDPKILLKVFFNCAKSFQKDKDKKCLTLCDRLLTEFNLPNEKIISVLLLKAEYYLESNEFKKIYEILIKIESTEFDLDLNDKALLGRMYTLYYIRTGDLKAAEKAINAALKTIPNDDFYIHQLYEAKFVYCLYACKDVNLWFERALTYARKLKDMNSIEMLYREFLEHATVSNDNFSLNILCNTLLKDLKSNSSNIIININMEFIKYLLKNNKAMLKKYISSIENF